MKQKLVFMIAGILAAGTLFAQSGASSVDLLKSGFVNPPTSARPKVYWWWLNGYTDPVRLKAELLSMKNAGIGGVDIFEIGLPKASDPNGIIPAGPEFMGTESLNNIKLAVEEAGKLQMEVGLNLASSWNAGGKWVEPAQAAKTLYFSKWETATEGKVDQKLGFPAITPDRTGKKREIEYGKDGRPAYYEEIAVIAVPANTDGIRDTSTVLNLTRFFDPKTERLKWEAPKGKWEVYRYICSNSGEQLIRPSPASAGPIIDHFDSVATEKHVMYFVDRLKPVLGDFEKTALKYFYLASYEAKEFAWTHTLPATFRKLNGYDIDKFLPAIFNNKLYAKELMQKFDHDFSFTFSELMIHNHYRKAKEICNRYGLKIISESGGPGHLHHIPVETLKALGTLDIPRGEFWYNRTFFKEDSLVDYIWLVKEIAAASHTYKRGIVEEEAFTSYWDWQEGPLDLKKIADRAFCEGMNRLVIHGFPHNPSQFGVPGIAYFAGTHYNDKQTWWPKIRPFNDYLSRISYLLQKARFQADVLYYYGDDIPNLVPPKNTRFKVGDGYDYEIVNTEILLRDLTVKNGKWVLPGVGEYPILTLGKGHRMNVEAAKKLELLKRKGGVIADYKSVLEKLKVPPAFSYEEQQKGELDFIHYSTDDRDFYLIRNTTDRNLSKTGTFRQNGKYVELWHPVSGKTFPLVSKENKGLIHVKLKFAPFEAYFVVFVKKKSIKSPEVEDRSPEKLELSGPWKLSIPSGSRDTTFTRLFSWPAAKQNVLKYFSGIASYQTEFEWKSGVKERTAILDLGDMAEVAEVWLNGENIGIVWAKPFQLSLKGKLKQGKNSLRIEIANTWTNRLTGDAVLNEKYTETNIVKANKNLVPWEDVPLRKSGLLGPVQLIFED